jgi:hypothetical protein
MDQIFWSGGTPVESLRISHDALASAGIFSPETLITKERLLEVGFRLQGKSASYEGEFGGVLKYALAYTYSVVTRGQLYAFANDESHAYEPAWPRRVAMLEPLDDPQEYGGLINWGWILANLNGLVWAYPLRNGNEEQRFRICLERLRKFTLDEQINVSSLLGKRDRIFRIIYNGLRASGFADSRRAVEQLDCFDSPSLLLTPTAKKATGRGRNQGRTYWRSTVLDISERIARGRQPEIKP